VSVITYTRMVLAPEHDPYDPTAVGPRVRALREAMGLSLRELALRCGVSSAMLSQVERGETSPTLQVAARIATGLELRLSALLRLDESGSVTIVRCGERRVEGNPRRGHHAEVLTPPIPGQRAELSTTRRCTSRAAAKLRWSRPARWCCSATGGRTRSRPATA